MYLLHCLEVHYRRCRRVPRHDYGTDLTALILSLGLGEDTASPTVYSQSWHGKASTFDDGSANRSGLTQFGGEALLKRSSAARNVA